MHFQFLYVVGSSNCKTKHRVLKFDRRFKNNLVIYDNKRVMTTAELNEYRAQEGFDPPAKIEPTVAFGIVGFVRFLEGYYLILIVKRRCMAIIGRHCIYKIEDTTMMYIPNEDRANGEELKYLRVFNNVDMKSNFYFSYSYDLSNTLQVCPCFSCTCLYLSHHLFSSSQYNLSPFYSRDVDQFKCGFGHTKTLWDMADSFVNANEYDSFNDNYVYINPNMKFVWNEHLISAMCNVHNDFFLYICHGFVSQAVMPVSGRNLLITLIARRSKKYAGTRYLKRGANCDGFTANEVETEQIVHDGNISSFRYGLYTSFVQLRGSVPTFWSQNIVKIAPKPPINIDLKDPFFEAAGKHFNNLLYDYGSPSIVLNLVKRKEKKPQESILYNEFEEAIEYLNQFLPKQHQIMLIGFDMARMNKMKDQNVITLLSEIALYTLKKTGFFQNRNIAINRESGWPKTFPNCGSSSEAFNSSSSTYQPIFQTGIIRVNCVDCLDRTNTAQFAIGRIALAHQLFTMGVIAKPELPFDTDIVRLLEELYEDHGDTLALQYGGSQLVHRIKTYRKIAPLTSQSKDIMQSLSRYYSNAFSDSDKQNAINLFLGVYQASRGRPLWEMVNDYALHHSFALCVPTLPLGNGVANGNGGNGNGSGDGSQNGHSNAIVVTRRGNQGVRNRYTKWWSDEIALCLPRAAREFFKDSHREDPIYVKRFLSYDWFFDVHRLQECNVLQDLFLFNMKKSKSYVDVMSVKKQANFRTQNRQSLVGIPLNTASGPNDDSDPSDLSDTENDNIIIRFESDCQGLEHEDGDVHDGAEYDFSSGGHESHGVTPDLESKAKQFNANWLALSNRDFTRPSYERRVRSHYRSLVMSPTNSSLGHKLYSRYLDYESSTSGEQSTAAAHKFAHFINSGGSSRPTSSESTSTSGGKRPSNSSVEQSRHSSPAVSRSPEKSTVNVAVSSSSRHLRHYFDPLRHYRRYFANN